MFHGPVREAVPFFESLGFKCPERKDHASFLQEVTTPKGKPAEPSCGCWRYASPVRHRPDPAIKNSVTKRAGSCHHALRRSAPGPTMQPC